MSPLRLRRASSVCSSSRTARTALTSARSGRRGSPTCKRWTFYAGGIYSRTSRRSWGRWTSSSARSIADWKTALEDQDGYQGKLRDDRSVRSCGRSGHRAERLARVARRYKNRTRYAFPNDLGAIGRPAAEDDQSSAAAGGLCGVSVGRSDGSASLDIGQGRPFHGTTPAVARDQASAFVTGGSFICSTCAPLSGRAGPSTGSSPNGSNPARKLNDPWPSSEGPSQ